MEAQRTDLLSYFATAGKNLGHKQAKCKQSPRCLKCGKNHIIETCVGPKSTQVVCACWAGSLSANYRGCRKFPGNTVWQ